MATLPSISVVTPSLNQGRFIRATIESVLGQRYPHLECLVQDGESTDDTLAILESFSDRVSWTSEADRGQSDAINRGLRRATGDILCYLNSDDLLLPGALAAVGAAFAEDPSLAVVFGQAMYIDAEGHALMPYRTRPDGFDILSEECAVAQAAVFFRRQIWDRVGEFDPALHHAMDYDYWFRIAAVCGPPEIRYLPIPLAGVRLHGDAKSVADWGAGLETVRAVVLRHTGRIPLGWCAAKWDSAVDGRSQLTSPHPFPWRAALPTIVDYLRHNPPQYWARGARQVAGGLVRRLSRRQADGAVVRTPAAPPLDAGEK